MDLKFKYLLKPGTNPPKVAQCTECTTKFTNDEVVESVISSKASSLRSEWKDKTSDDAINEIGIRFGGISVDKQTAYVQLSHLLLKYHV